jgi:hypothetical protein
MKQFFYLSLLVFTLFFVSTPRVEAHFLETDGSIGGILHMDPSDNPIVNQPTNFYFDIKDRDGKFSFSKCDCQLVIQQAGKELYSQSITTVGANSAKSQFVFPSKDSYDVMLRGKPLVANAFQDFTITWDVQVGSTQQAAKASNPVISFVVEHFLHALIFGGGFIYFFVWLAIETHKDNRAKAKNGNAG